MISKKGRRSGDKMLMHGLKSSEGDDFSESIQVMKPLTQPPLHASSMPSRITRSQAACNQKRKAPDKRTRGVHFEADVVEVEGADNIPKEKVRRNANVSKSEFDPDLNVGPVLKAETLEEATVLCQNSKVKKRSMDATEDRLSELPEPILEKILCLLPLAKEGARLSTLSKALNSAWSSLSYYNFDHDFFYEDNRCINRSEKIPDSVNVVDQILAKRQKKNISIQKILLSAVSFDCSSYVHNWIKTLVVLNIKELSLRVRKPDDGYNTLPEHIFAAEELNVLHLRGFKLELPHDGIKFSSLRELSLSNTFLDEHFIRAICESCPGLENITLYAIHGLTSLQIAGTLPKLRKMKCSSQFQIVDIVAPNLEDLNIESSNFWITQVAIKVPACKALKKLTLYYVGVTEEWLENLFSSLPNLEDLHLDSCGALRTLKISSDKLEHLQVERGNLISAELDTPNLTRFSYRTGSDPLPALKLKASVLLKVELVLSPFPKTLDRHWYSMLMKFLGNFKQSKAIRLLCSTEKAIVIPKDMRKHMVPPLYGTDCLHLIFYSGSKNYSIVEALDSLLWISPHVDTLSFERNPDLISTLKFIYNDASDEYEKISFASLPSECWRHKLKGVNMENFTCKEQEELRNYLFTDAGKSEMIDIPKKFTAFESKISHQ